MRNHIASIVTVLATLSTPTAYAGNQYVLDDGVPNASLTYGLPSDYCWFQSFDTAAPSDAITSVQVMWPVGALPAGSEVHVCVWEDPNDDGDPSDALLVSQELGTVPNVTYSTYTAYPLHAPAPVSGKFFVGAFVTTNGLYPAIALMDFDSPLSMRAWYSPAPAGTFEPEHLAGSFYSHVETLGAGIHGVFMLRAEGSGETPTTYCVGKTNSLGCHPSIHFYGVPSASAGSGFHLYAIDVLNRAPGMLIYGTNGHATTPFGGGTLCVAAPLRRTPTQYSGGNFGTVDCTGTYHFDFSAWIASGNDPTLVPGTSVNAQFVYRDAGFAAPNTVGLTDAIDFTLAP